MGKKSNPEEEQALKAEVKALKETLAGQQMELRTKGLPVIVLVEGWAAAGKGSLIGDLICELDPRFYNVVSPAVGPEREDRYPFLWPYAKEIPENGQIMFYDSGWMENVVRRYLRREITAGQYKDHVRSVREFERQLRDGGYIVLKLFLRIEREEQEKRLPNLGREVQRPAEEVHLHRHKAVVRLKPRILSELKPRRIIKIPQIVRYCKRRLL